MELLHRPRRTRKNAIIREAVAETRVHPAQFIYPYFVKPGRGMTDPILAMPGISHFTVDTLLKDVEVGLKLGLNKVLLFGVQEPKSEEGDAAWSERSVVPSAIRELKKVFGEDLYVITDVCLCAYTTHGHCGLVHDHHVLNDESVERLVKMALAHATAGADMVAPSDMMDGRIGAMRQGLDMHGFTNTALMSYAVKFASAYYGPFREAAGSAPGFGDRRSYQMDARNGREAMREAMLDEQEGADILMVKPALAYLDILAELRQRTDLPLACYNVSAEYSMVKVAAAAGLVDERLMTLENLHAFARAGADLIITYHAREVLEKRWL
ncbi:MAG: porphobilinogen synthase [Flavobacteriales bacterium]|nr:porphobilinogen synthase [Flavobacteriales bacterium]MBK9287527.1 porphobilinogen synthase [Flavobacteriales bacterium]MBL0037311.1 porphobilinogen synthase [Flavobacteriales bacterium]